MKKNNVLGNNLTDKVPIKHFLLIMRTTFILLFVCIFYTMAENGYTQNARVTLNKRNVSLKDVLNEIESQTDYLFIYNNEVNTREKVSVKAKQQAVSNVLKSLLKNKDVDYSMEGNHIILSARKKKVESDKETLSKVVQQQKKRITGTVVDAAGEPIIGANVVEAGTTNGTVTDVDGSFLLDVGDNATIRVSYIGYLEQEVTSTGKTSINVTLLEDTQSLDEVIVVGYGTQRKANLTGAVSNVQIGQLDKRTVAQTSSALQGLVPGLTVTQRSGKPGADGGTIRIRGNTTLGDNNPLVLIDGVESSLNSIDPASIESISILKDAASSAIYGNRAANGVILITTKRAESGKAFISYKGYLAKGVPTHVPKYVGAVDFMKYISIAKRAVGMTPEYTEEYIKEYEEGVARNDPNYPDVDWFKETATNDAMMYNHFLTLSLGTERLRSMTQVGYISQNGITERTNYKRYTLRSNNDYQVFPVLSFSSDISILYVDRHEPNRLGSGESFNGRIPSNQAAYLPDGRYGPGWNGNNPVAHYKDGGLITFQDPSAILNFTATLNPLKGLEVQGQYALNYWENHTKNWNKRVQLYLNNGLPDPNTQSNSNLSETSGRNMRNMLVGRATYSKSINETHNFKLMSGYQQETYWNKWHSGYREIFPFPDYPVLNAGGSENQRSSGSASAYALQALFGRLNYDYNGKYLFEANIRYDGSSRFAEGYRWGTFPSFSAGWRISEEEFWDSYRDFMPNLKLRASWGQLGNQNTLSGYYPSQSTINLSPNYVFDKNIESGAAITAMANNIISWETTTMSNVALEFNLLNKLDFTAEYYNRVTDDILLNLNIPLIIGLSAPAQNAGKVENKGWELSANYNDRFGEFNFSATFNISDVKNKILDIKGIDETGLTVNREGYPMGSIFGYQADGYIVPEDYDSEGNYSGATQIGNFGPGDIKYIDQLTEDTDGDGIPDAGDGVIDTKDRVVIGSTIPRYTYGLNLYGEYKGFDLNLFLQGVGKADGYIWGHTIGSFYEGGSMPEIGKDYWTPENRNAQFPRLAFNNSNNQQNSSFWIKDASYLRLKNVQFGYTLPSKITSKIGVSNLRLYVSTDNVFTISNFWKSFDVEAPILTGYGQFYPIMRTTTFGVDLTF